MQHHQPEQVEVRVDQDLYEILKARSTFEDTFSSVLRRELGIPAPQDVPQGQRTSDRLREWSPAPERSTGRARKRGKGSRSTRARAAAGTLLPENEYYRPILEILAEKGGQAPKQTVIEQVGHRLA